MDTIERIGCLQQRIAELAAAGDEDKNAWAEANAALQHNGFKRLDVQYSRGSDVRDREVREMEDALPRRFEGAMTDEEREQLALSREYGFFSTTIVSPAANSHD